MSKSKLDLINIKELEEIVYKNNRYSEVLKEIGYSQLKDKRTIQKLKDICDKNNIIYTHLTNEEEHMRVCTICNQEKSINEYYKINNHYLSYCKECKKEKEKIKYEQKVKKMDDYKKTLKCIKCGEKRFYLLDFHHRDPAEKDFTISDHTRASFEILKNEIEKCDVLCSNCHREWHYLNTHENLEYNAWLGE